MHEPIDLESLRRSNTERLAGFFSQLTSGITHIGWHTATATVSTCRPIASWRHPFPNRGSEFPLLADYIIEFSYIVDGTTYTGVRDSPYELEPKDQFDIRYNPSRPGENNSLGSSGNTGSRIGGLITSFLLVLTVVALFYRLLHRF